MTFPGDQPVASGQSYTVTEVDGHRPTDLTEFIGTTAITLLRDGHSGRLGRRRNIGHHPVPSERPGSGRQGHPGLDHHRPRRRHVPRRARRILLETTDRTVLVSAVRDRRGQSARSCCAGFLYQGLEGSTTGVLRGRLIFTARLVLVLKHQ
jgi:hypothetical protein